MTRQSKLDLKQDVNESDAAACESRLAELVALQRIGRELNSTLDMERILDLLIREGVSVTLATHGSVLLFDKQKSELQPRVCYGYTAQQVETLKATLHPVESEGKIPLRRRGNSYRAFTTGQTTVIDDVRGDPDYVEVVQSTRSKLTMPIRYGSEIVGVLDLESPRVSAFTSDSQRFIVAIAEQAATAIGNAQRYAERIERERAARRRNEQLRNLIAISRELHTGRALDDILDQIVQAIPATGGFNVATLSLVQDNPPMLRRVAAAGIPLAAFEILRQTEQPLSVFEKAIQERHCISQSYLLPHQGEGEWEGRLDVHVMHQDDDRGQGRRWHPRDMLLVPLKDSKGQLLGLLSADDPQDGRMPSRESIEILELFASQAASAIENARLYDELELRVQKRTEELAEAMRHWAVEVDKTTAIVESIFDAVIVFDAHGKVVLANPATRRVLGLAPETLVQWNMYKETPEGLSEEDAEVAGELFLAATSARETLASGQRPVDVTFQAAGRVIHASFSRMTLRENEPLVVVAVFRDITQEAELDRAKSDFVSMAAHDLRSPMISTMGYVDLLLAGIGGQLGGQQKELLQVIKSNSQRLMTLVNNLLDLAKIESGGLVLDIQLASVADVVTGAVYAIRKQIEAKNQTLIVDVPKTLPKVMIDRDRMIQVATNLLSNAHKYSPRGSEIAIRGQQQGDYLRLDFRDQGIGISKRDQERLFTRFFRAENAIATQEQGTGLGLSICREIVGRHGGTIQVESELGKGSTFSIVLPLEPLVSTEEVG